MVGIIHRLFFDLLESCAGAPGVQAVRERAGVPADRVFQINAAYDDAEWGRLVAAGCAVLGLSPVAAESALAEQFYRDALTRWPVWFQMSRDSREFLLRQPTIHNSLAAGLSAAGERQAVADKFRVERQGEDVVAHYKSPNRHCGLYKALAALIIAHYDDEGTVTESHCQHTGAAECEIRIHWTRCGGRP